MMKGVLLSAAFSPDGTLLVSGSANGNLFIWDMSTFQRIARLGTASGGVMRIAFSPDGTLVASGGWDGAVRLWGIPATSETADSASEEENDTITSPPCFLSCTSAGGELSVEITCETGQVTRNVNNSTSVQYNDNSTIYTLTIDETRTYSDSGNSYEINGTIVFVQALGTTAIRSYDLTVTGGAFGDVPQTCKQ
jgi:hypothetical protein